MRFRVAAVLAEISSKSVNFFLDRCHFHLDPIQTIFNSIHPAFHPVHPYSQPLLTPLRESEDLVPILMSAGSHLKFNLQNQKLIYWDEGDEGDKTQEKSLVLILTYPLYPFYPC